MDGSLVRSLDGRIPADVATDYRRYVVGWLDSPTGRYYMEQSFIHSFGLNPTHAQKAAATGTQLNGAILETLNEAELLVVSKDMVGLVDLAAPSLPMEQVASTDLPFAAGMAILETPLELPVLHPEIGRSNCNVLAWGSVPGRGVLLIFAQNPASSGDSYWDEVAPDDLPPFAVLSTMVLNFGMNLTEAADEPAFPVARWMVAMWSIIQEPYVTNTAVQPGRAASKRAARAGRQPDAVRVIMLRRRAAEAVREAKDAKYHLTKRFIVRGHWRNQACGLNRSEHKLRWIAPFVKGPDNGEFLTGEKLYRLER